MPLRDCVVSNQVLRYGALAYLYQNWRESTADEGGGQTLINDRNLEYEAGNKRAAGHRIHLWNRCGYSDVVRSDILLGRLRYRNGALNEVSCKPAWLA